MSCATSVFMKLLSLQLIPVVAQGSVLPHLPLPDVANHVFPTSRGFRVAWHRRACYHRHRCTRCHRHRCACYHRRRRSEHPRTGPSTHTLACVSCVHPEAGLLGCRQYEITPRTIFHSGSANSQVPSTVRHLPDGFLSATGMGRISPASPPLPPSQAWLPLAVCLQV